MEFGGESEGKRIGSVVMAGENCNCNSLKDDLFTKVSCRKTASSGEISRNSNHFGHSYYARNFFPNVNT